MVYEYIFYNYYVDFY